VDLALLRDALTSDSGYLAHRPRGGRAAVFLNKAETPEALGAARELAPALVPHWQRVVAGSAALGPGRALAGAGAGLLS
jgi:hypothetical protein